MTLDKNSSVAETQKNPLFASMAEQEPQKGRGSCTKCSCTAYGDAGSHNGFCSCGHSAADHN